MSAKADRLRGRLSINPDELPQPPRPAPAPAPVPSPEPAPPPEPEPAETAAEEASEPAAPRPARRPAKPRPPRVQPNAVQDPGITPGKKDYRSFYIEDTVFARFRAAVYWLARHPDASAEVAENMSVAVEEWMRETAGDLEKRYNHGEVFRMPPATKRRKRGGGP